jgi:lincosamide nucleotidyltransferase A/C/D/E
MTRAAVLAVLHRLEAAGLQIWIDGGWGVDALLGEETRSHADLDLAVDRVDLERVQAALASLGFEHATAAEPGLPARLVLRDGRARQVDVHPLVFDEGGDGWQDLGGGRWALYPANGLSGRGRIGEREVNCLTAELQLAFHVGYDPVERDRREVALLRERFGRID